MNWPSLTWETWFLIVGITLCLFLMCGGMLRGGGCCGAGMRSRMDDQDAANDRLDRPEQPAPKR